MNERWEKIRNQAKEQWTQHVPPELQQKVRTWRDNWTVARLDFDNYTEDLTLSRREFGQSRLGLITHVNEVIRGRGGKTTAEADARTAAWIDNLGEHFHVVASQIAADDVHAHYRAKNLSAFMQEDADFRLAHLIMQRDASNVSPPLEYDIQTIVYSYADPNKEWATQPWIEEAVQPISREEAVELYKQIVTDQVQKATESKRANIYENSDQNTVLKAAAIGLGVAAITSALLGNRKRR